jgi:putative Mg2+ transporter-C (MgtC) family protein
MPWYLFAFHLSVALFLGALVGAERQWRQRTAGLRTNCLVAMGSAMFVMMGGLIAGDGSQGRVAAYVVSGIGFLGGGVILKDGFSIRGLNTAATLWCTAAYHRNGRDPRRQLVASSACAKDQSSSH